MNTSLFKGLSRGVLVVVGVAILLAPAATWATENQGCTVKRDPADPCKILVIYQFGIEGTAEDSAAVEAGLKSQLEMTFTIPCDNDPDKSCTVTVSVTVRLWQNIPPGERSKYHHITMKSDGNPSDATPRAPNGPSGSGSWRRGRTSSEWAHEALHLGGVGDKYCGKRRGDWGSSQEPECDDPPGPKPCDCVLPPTPPKVRCTKPCNGYAHKIMAETWYYDAGHNVVHVNVTSEDIIIVVDNGGCNSCPKDPCCPDPNKDACMEYDPGSGPGIITPSDTTLLVDFDFDSTTTACFMEGWSSVDRSGRGDFGGIYPGTMVHESDRCGSDLTCAWGFFDDPSITNYSCGGWPSVGAVPYAGGGHYVNNEIWSPAIPWAGASGSTAFLEFDVYRDLPISELVVYSWHVRSIVGGVTSGWRNHGCAYYGDSSDWTTHREEIGSLIDPGADEIQIALSVRDMGRLWGGHYGDGLCHSNAPLFDNVRVYRYGTPGPQFNWRDIDQFQDTFAADGTLTGTARADVANDISPLDDPQIVAGDSVSVTVNDADVGIAEDLISGVGPAVYAYVSVRPTGQAGKSGPDIEAPEVGLSGLRYPLLDSLVYDDTSWYVFRMDSVVSSGEVTLPHRYCFDLRDDVFTPGDTINYFFGAQSTNGFWSYASRKMGGQGVHFVTDDLTEALSSPMEFTVLPAGGWRRGGDILYVDQADDRGEPVQSYFDDALKHLGIYDLVDRYDVLGPSSVENNGPGSRVTAPSQIVDCYRTIIWSSGNVSAGTVSDGVVPEKSDDWSLLLTFLNTHPNNPGLYLSGNDLAEEWMEQPGPGAVAARSQFMNFGVVHGDHVELPEPISPELIASGPIFEADGFPDTFFVAGGCPTMADFDAMELSLSQSSTAMAFMACQYPSSGMAAILAQETPNAAGSTARVVNGSGGLVGIWLRVHPERAAGVAAGTRGASERYTGLVPESRRTADGYPQRSVARQLPEAELPEPVQPGDDHRVQRQGARTRLAEDL